MEVSGVFEFVRHVGNEIPSHSFGAANVGEVMEDTHNGGQPHLKRFARAPRWPEDPASPAMISRT